MKRCFFLVGKYLDFETKHSGDKFFILKKINPTIVMQVMDVMIVTWCPINCYFFKTNKQILPNLPSILTYLCIKVHPRWRSSEIIQNS